MPKPLIRLRLANLHLERLKRDPLATFNERNRQREKVNKLAEKAGLPGRISVNSLGFVRSRR